MTESHDTGLLPEDLDPDRPAIVETPWGTLALYLVDERWVAADAWCPHMLGPLFQGTRSGTRIVCPWHAWCFDLATGARVDEPDVGDEDCRLAVHATHVGADGRLRIDPA